MTPEKLNSIFIATSIDGYIADKKGGLDWLHSIPNPENRDMGFVAFMDRVDALVMGRTTFETVIGFDVPWPYTKPVYVLSNRMKEIPASHEGKAFLVNGELTDVLATIHGRGHYRLYIDGGSTIRGFLKQDLIDEMVLSTIPILLGGGAPLFGDLIDPLPFELIESHVELNQITQRLYRRKR